MGAMFKDHKKIVCVWTIILILGILFCTSQLVRPKQHLDVKLDTPVQLTSDYVGEQTVCQNVGLRSAVWKVRVHYKTEASEDAKSIFGIRDNTIPANSLRSMGQHSYTGLEVISFDAYLYRNARAVEVYVSTTGEQMTISEVEFVETNLLWTKRLAEFLFWMILIGILLVVFNQDCLWSLEKKKVLLSLLVISCVASSPFLFEGSISGGDLGYHLHRIEGVAESLRNGIFPVRIEPQWQQGFGYADAVFYCPLFLYFPGILRILGFTVSEAYNYYCILFTFLTVFTSYYCFKNISNSSFTGVLSSAIYTLSIPRIHKLVVSSALGEGTAIAFLPLVLYGIWRILFDENSDCSYRTWLPFSLGYMGLIQSHVLSCEITFFVTLITFVVFVRRLITRKMIIPVLKSIGTVILTCLWYLVPFFDYYITQDVAIKHAAARTIQNRGIYIAHLLVQFWRNGGNPFLEEHGMKDSQPMGIGLLLVCSAFIFFALWLCGRLEKKQYAFGKYCVVMGTCMLLFSLSIFPWDTIQKSSQVLASLVSSIQFPNRFLDWGVTFLVVVFGFTVRFYSVEYKKETYTLALILTIFTLAWGSGFLLQHVQTFSGRVNYYNAEGYGTGYISGGEYLIYGANPDVYRYNRFASGESIEIVEKQSGALYAKADVINTSNADDWVEVPLAYYKGYCAYSDFGKIVVDSGENAVCRVHIPANYKGKIRVQFESPWYWRLAELVSVLSYLIIILWLWRYRCQKRRESYS